MRRKRIQKAINTSENILIPTGNLPIIAERLVLITATFFGIYFVIIPSDNYCSHLATLLYFTMIIGGLYSNSRYRPPSGDYAPTVSIIVPVYNGEEHIYEVMKTYINIDYPKDKTEIIIANDGSTDNTPQEIARAIDEHPETNIRLLSHYPNKEKHHTITNAIHQSRGNIIVRADADTYLHEDSVLKIVRHFKDEEIAGVTGWTHVRNRDDNIFT